MKVVRERIAERRRAIAAHPFYAWLGDERAPTPRRFDFALALTPFITGFADLNRWFLRYPEPRDAYRRAINHHTLEDEQHSALFLEDWRALGLDEHLGWTPGETLAFLYASPATEPLRRDAAWITRQVVENPDPLVRFALMESIESWGHVVFAATASSASALTRRTGVEYRYFGPFHLERELGTLIDGEEIFDEAVLDADRRTRALALVDGLFDLAERESDDLLALVGGGVDVARRLTDPSEGPLRATCADDGALRSDPGRDSDGGDDARPVPASTRRIERHLERAHAVAAAHPLLARVRADEDAAATLRELAVFWAPDCLGYRDLVLHVMAPDEAQGPDTAAVRRWATALGTHHRLFLADWAALGCDEHLGLTASETLELYCRSAHSHAQRESAATFVDLAHRHPDPLARFWLLTALQASGDAFFAATRELALRVEAQHGVRLDYFADRHELAEPHAARRTDHLRARALSSEQEATVLGMIDTVFARLVTQMDACAARTRVSAPVA